MNSMIIKIYQLHYTILIYRYWIYNIAYEANSFDIYEKSKNSMK